MRRALPLALIAVVPALLAAQVRSLDLTGKPAATIAEPFTKISGVAELSPATAVVTDNMEAKVVVVDFARGSVKPVGAKGRGPNEYQFPSPPVATASGVYVFDAYQKRALVISANGSITMKQLPDASAISRVRGADATGRFYFEGSDFDPNTGRFSDTLPVVRWDPSTNAVETVTRVWGGGRVRIQRGGQPASLARAITPFPHLDAWTPLPDGRVAIVHRDPFRVEVRGTAVVNGPALANAPIAITAAERDTYRATNTPGRTSAILIGGGSGPQQQGPQWEDAHFPLTMPAFIGADVLVTPEGEIWIGRSFSGTAKTRRYDVVDAIGRIVGSATLNAMSRVVGFGPKSVYVARVNPDDDLVYLSKYVR
jgi:hypothetical protein